MKYIILIAIISSIMFVGCKSSNRQVDPLDTIYFPLREYTGIDDISGKVGCLNGHGKVVLPFKYSYLEEIGKDLFKIKHGDLYGVINIEGDTIIPCRYDNIGKFESGLVKVQYGLESGLFDTKGRAVFPLSEGIKGVFDQYVIADKERMRGVYDLQGNEMISPRFNGFVAVVDNKYVKAEHNGKYGLYDINGKEIVPHIYEEMHMYKSIIGVERNGRAGMIDYDGNIIVPIKYEYMACPFYSHDTIIGCRTKKHNKWGVIGLDEQIIIPFQYEEIMGSECCGLIGVQKDGKCGFIDINGNVKIPYRYDWCFGFNPDTKLSSVRQQLSNKIFDYRDAYIDTTGYEVILFEWNPKNMYEGMVGIQKNGLWGYANYKGEIVVPCIYDEVGYFENGYGHVIKDNKMGYVDKQGNVIIPCEYSLYM